MGAAVALAQSSKIPPEAAIDAPDWYAPVHGAKLDVTGLARARLATGRHFSWKLEWGAGEVPTSWSTVASGSSSGEVSDFGSVDLQQVRAALASYTPPLDTGGPVFSATSPNPFKNEFTVRLTVTGDGIPTPGVDRRVFTSVSDPSLRKDYPKRMGTGGEAPIRYADLNGDNVQELIVPTEDGTVHAYEPDGSELPGWPVHTGMEAAADGHGAAPGFKKLDSGTPPREPLRGPVIADLDDDGQPEVIDTAGLHVYVWEPNGKPRPGFPVSSKLSFCGASHESQPLGHPKCGFLSSPAVGRLEGPQKPLDIVVPALDGHLYGFDGDGRALDGFPVKLQDDSVPADQRMTAESINEPAIGDLNGDGVDDVVAATNETYDANPPSGDDIPGLIGQGLTDALANAAGGSSRVYAVNGANGHILSGWPLHLNGAIQDTLPLIGPGQDPAILKLGGQTTIVASTTGSATIGEYDTSGHLVRGVQQGAYGPGSDATDRSGTVNLFESPSIGDLLGAGPDIVKYGLTLSDLANLLLTGQNVAVQPPDRRLRRGVGHPAPGLSADHRRLPVPFGLGRRQRQRRDRQPGRRRDRARPAPRLRRHDRPRRRRLPEGDRRVALCAGCVLGRRADGGHHARGLPLPVGPAEAAALSGRVAFVPPRSAAERQLRSGRHAARRPHRSRGAWQYVDVPGARRRLRLRDRGEAAVRNVRRSDPLGQLRPGDAPFHGGQPVTSRQAGVG